MSVLNANVENANAFLLDGFQDLFYGDEPRFLRVFVLADSFSGYCFEVADVKGASDDNFCHDTTL